MRERETETAARGSRLMNDSIYFDRKLSLHRHFLLFSATQPLPPVQKGKYERALKIKVKDKREREIWSVPDVHVVVDVDVVEWKVKKVNHATAPPTAVNYKSIPTSFF